MIQTSTFVLSIGNHDKQMGASLIYNEQWKPMAEQLPLDTLSRQHILGHVNVKPET